MQKLNHVVDWTVKTIGQKNGNQQRQGQKSCAHQKELRCKCIKLCPDKRLFSRVTRYGNHICQARLLLHSFRLLFLQTFFAWINAVQQTGVDILDILKKRWFYVGEKNCSVKISDNPPVAAFLKERNSLLRWYPLTVIVDLTNPCRLEEHRSKQYGQEVYICIDLKCSIFSKHPIMRELRWINGLSICADFNVSLLAVCI